MTDQQLTIREMCDLFAVTPRTLRFYEAKELIAPVREGQKRLYSKREVARVKLILRGRKFGFSLEEIRQLLDLYYLGDRQHTQFLRTFKLGQDRLAVMKDQRAELDLTICELEEQLKWGLELIASQSAKSAAE